MAGPILMFFRLAFGNPHINSLVAVKKQPKGKSPTHPKQTSPISPVDSDKNIFDISGCNIYNVNRSMKSQKMRIRRKENNEENICKI
jgi:hypothetical protein